MHRMRVHGAHVQVRVRACLDFPRVFFVLETTQALRHLHAKISCHHRVSSVLSGFPASYAAIYQATSFLYYTERLTENWS